MAEITATERTRRQGQRLRKLREDRGVSKARLMDVLGFSSSQTYDLYERGVSVLRGDRIAAWAGAFGIPEHEFFALILASDSPLDAEIAFRSALQGHLTEDQIEKKWQAHKHEPLKDQQSAAEGYIRMAERIRRESATPPEELPARPRRRRAAENRSA